MTIDFPDVLPDNATFRLRGNTTAFESELNATVQHGEMPGAKWVANLTFTNRARTQGRVLAAFMARLSGSAGRFKMSPPDLDQQGTFAGSGVVAGASQTGSTLSTSGWAPSQASLARVGDYIEVGGELKMITQDASSDGAGAAVLHIAPPLRKSPANASSIETDAPKAVFYLINDDQAAWQLSAPLVYAVTMAIEEDIT